MVKVCAILFAIIVCVVLDYSSVEAAKDSLANKIPKAFYCKIKKICDNVEKFIECILKNASEKSKINKSVTDELKTVFEKYETCKNMPDCKDVEAFKAYLCKMAEVKEITDKLQVLAGEVKILMKCTSLKD